MIEIKSPDFKGALIISDRVITEPIILEKSVIYRPKSLVVGLGLHWDTHKDDIESGIKTVMKDNGLSFLSIRNIWSLLIKIKIKGGRVESIRYSCRNL